MWNVANSLLQPISQLKLSTLPRNFVMMQLLNYDKDHLCRKHIKHNSYIIKKHTQISLCVTVCLSVCVVPLEWKEMRQSHRGHLSTVSLRMASSGKMTTVMYSNLQSLSRIWVIGLDLDFFIMQQIPTTICRSGG